MMNHVGPDNHPEAPERIDAIYSALEQYTYLKIPARLVTQEELTTCHEKKYLQKISTLTISSNGDMFTSSGTLLAAQLAAGGSIELAKALLTNKIKSGFAIVRPPGHHAKCDGCGGFCFYNNAMLAAVYLTNANKRVYIVDFDLHLGDGTIGIMNTIQKFNNNLAYFSIHRWDDGAFYPSGNLGKTKIGQRIVTVGYNGKQGNDYYVDAFSKYFLPHALQFNPDFIIVSAGFDAHKDDPMRGGNLTEQGYTDIMKMIVSVCPRIGMVLEGGYNLQAIAKSAMACVDVLIE